MKPLYKIILCDYLNPINDKKCDYVSKGCIVLKKYKDEYRFFEIGKEKDIYQNYYNKRSVEVLDKTGLLAMPGFFDMHFHWVQDDVRLMPKDSLLEWLSKYTWPYEAKFKDKMYSKKKAESFSNELLAMGTLGGACYASIHGHTVDDALKFFKGDYIAGNVLMTMNSPDYLTQTKANALKLVESKSKKFKKSYAMTPRFAPTTHPDVMKKGAEIARKNGSFIQTHLSETENEIDFVLSIYKDLPGFEKVKTYTEIYKKCKILGKKTIMGHGIYLSKEELKLMSNTQTAIAHCPTSNAPIKEKGLGSGLFNFKRAERYNIPWALGSDIGGGPYLSMFDVMHSFVKQNAKASVAGATYTKALYRSTVAGASILGKKNIRGDLSKGSKANLILVDSPKNSKQTKRAELILSEVLRKGSRKRADFLGLVKETFLAGESVFTS